MRLRAIATSCLLIAVSAGGVKTLAANPDCSRWIRQYQDALAKRSVRTKRHLVHAVRHIGVPRPHLLRANAPVHRKYTPRLTPAEMLKRFKILCGEDLPDDAMPAEFIPTGLEASLIQPSFPDAAPLPDVGGVPVALTPAPAVPAAVPAPAGTLLPGTPFTPLIPVSPAIPTTGPTNNGGGTTGTGTGTTGTGTGTTGTGTGTTPSPVPEPSTLLLLLTGALGVGASVLRRRRQMRHS